VSLVKKLNTHCTVLVGSKNGLERDFTNELKYMSLHLKLKALWQIGNYVIYIGLPTH